MGVTITWANFPILCFYIKGQCPITGAFKALFSLCILISLCFITLREAGRTFWPFLGSGKRDLTAFFTGHWGKNKRVLLLLHATRVLFLGERGAEQNFCTRCILWPLFQESCVDHYTKALLRSPSRPLYLFVLAGTRRCGERARGFIKLGAETRSREANNFAEFTRGVQLGKWASGLLLYCLFSVAQIYFGRTFAMCAHRAWRALLCVAAASSLMAAAATGPAVNLLWRLKQQLSGLTRVEIKGPGA